MNPWMYAKDWKRCAHCVLLWPVAKLQSVSDGLFVCRDRGECYSFKTAGHGLDPRPLSKRLNVDDYPEPPPVDMRAEEEFQLGAV